MVGYGHAMELLSVFTRKPPDMNPGMARFMSVRAYYDCTKAVEQLGYRVRPAITLSAPGGDLVVHPDLFGRFGAGKERLSHAKPLAAQDHFFIRTGA